MDLILSSSFPILVGSLMENTYINLFSGAVDSIDYVLNCATNVASFCKSPFVFTIGDKDDVIFEPYTKRETTNLTMICTQV